MNKGGKLVMPASVSDNGRQAAIAAGNANAEAHQNMLEQFGGSDGVTELSVPQFSGSPVEMLQV